jgi:phage terminase small subunit
MTKILSAKDQQFADLYYGGPDDMRGNATACYRAIHPRAKQRTCEVNGSRKLRQAEVVEYLESKREELTEATGVNAEYVLRQSIRYLEIAIGDRPTPENFNHAGVKAALELIGRHTRVQALKDTIEHSHTYQLEQRLAVKSKAVEKAALERNLKLVE